MKHKNKAERRAFLEEQYECGVALIDSLRKKKSYDGLFNLLRDFYPDNAHILYELLQNAEDAGATEVTFELESNVLRFIHNGRPFNEADIEGITGIGNTTKKDDVNAIGKFGVGFKAVFHYTDSPTVYSRTYSFGIIDKLCPVALDPMEKLDQDLTLFVFPFDSENKKSIEAYEEIQKGLEGFVPATLLFLQNIQKINWQVGYDTPRFICREKGEEGGTLPVFNIISNAQQKTTQWLRLSAPCKEAPRQSVCIAFELVGQKAEKDKYLFRIGETRGKLCIFFPAEKESTNLRFHLHAPFASTPDRASIKDQPENRSLRDQLVALLVEALPLLRDEGLLTSSFLELLPNAEDNLSEFYEPFMTAVVEEMQNNPLVPTHTGEHACAIDLTRGARRIRDVISEDDLTFLSGGNNKKWALGALNNSRADRFLQILNMPEWTVVDLINSIESKWDRYYDDDDTIWLLQKDPSWLRGLYLLLADANRFQKRALSRCAIIISSEGVYKQPAHIVFKPSGSSEDIPPDIAVVHPEILSGKKEQKDTLVSFLESIGVSELDEKHYLTSILRQFYRKDSQNCPEWKTHLKHMRRFMAYWNKTKDITIFRLPPFIWSEDDAAYHFARETFLDVPLENTGMTHVYGDSKYTVSKRYESLGTPFLQFVKAAGCIFELKPERSSCAKNSLINFSWDNKSQYYINRDWGLPEEASSKVSLKHPQISALVWNMMCSADEECLSARHRRTSRDYLQIEPSQLVKNLQDYEWVPAKDGSFYKPSELTRDQLPDQFEFRNSNGWLTAIEFGKNEQERKVKLEEEEFERQETTKRLRVGGITMPRDEMEEWEAIPPEERKAMREEWIQKNRAALFPERSSRNDERRAKHIRDNYKDAPIKTSAKRTRIVRASGPTVDPREYLEGLYTNDDDQLICQMCEREMPFTLRNGRYYFEAVQLIDDFKKESRELYVALCPVCAAKYKTLIKNHPASMQSLQDALPTFEHNVDQALNIHDPKLPELSIRFTETHLEDIRTVMACENEFGADARVDIEALCDALSDILLGERAPLDISNKKTGEVLIPAQRKITKTCIQKIIENASVLEIDPSPMRIKIMSIIDRFIGSF
jgi:hypothetical protein